MSEWWTYSLSDLLLFSPRVYDRLIALHNEAWWPLHVLLMAVGAALTVLAIAGPAWARARAVPLLLGAVWLWVAWAFLWHRYASINWAVTYLAPLFLVEAGLLLALAASPGGLRFVHPRGSAGLLGIALIACTLVGYPALALLTGRGLTGAEVFGITADPTAAFTLALLAMARGLMARLVMIIPVLWCVVTGLTLWTMDAPDFFVAPVVAILAIVVAIASSRRERTAGR